METTIFVLRNYVRNSKQRLLIAARTIEEGEDREMPNEYQKGKKSKKKIQWTQIQLHGQFIRETVGKASEDQWDG